MDKVPQIGVYVQFTASTMLYVTQFGGQDMPPASRVIFKCHDS